MYVGRPRPCFYALEIFGSWSTSDFTHLIDKGYRSFPSGFLFQYFNNSLFCFNIFLYFSSLFYEERIVSFFLFVHFYLFEFSFSLMTILLFQTHRSFIISYGWIILCHFNLLKRYLKIEKYFISFSTIVSIDSCLCEFITLYFGSVYRTFKNHVWV